MRFNAFRAKVPRYLLLMFVLLAAVIGLLGQLFYTHQTFLMKEEIKGDLAAISDLKVEQILNWKKERITDATILADSPVILSICRKSTGSHASSYDRGESLAWMEMIKKQGPYLSVTVVDAVGTVLVATSGEGHIESHESELVHEAVRTGKPVFSDFHRTERLDFVHIDLAAPLPTHKTGNTRPVGAIFLRIDPELFLYPLIQKWPTKSKTAETLLVRREGNEIVYLNELRHKKNTALTFRLPLGMGHLPAALAAGGREGIVEGVDYRGVPVLASLRKIPGTPWVMIAKDDIETIYAPVRMVTGMVLAMIFSLLLATAIGFGYWHRQQAARFYRRQYEMELGYQKERQDNEEKLKRSAAELEASNTELREAISKIRTLSGMLPICASCKRIRDDKGYWNQIELYIRDHSEAEFSHGICPDCAEKLYPDIFKKGSKSGQP